MAGTSILATICAERLTKFLAHYSRAHLRGSLVAKMRRRITPVEVMREAVEGGKPTVYVNPVERKYSLWQPADYQLQPKPRPLEKILGYRLYRSNNQLQRIKVPETKLLIANTHRSQLATTDLHVIRQPQAIRQPTLLQNYAGLIQNHLFNYIL